MAAVARGEESLNEIGLRFDITRERVRQIAQRQGVTRNHKPRPARLRLGPLYLDSCPDCGERVSTVKGRWSLHRKEAGHTLKIGGKLTDADMVLMTQLYAEGYGYHSLGHHFGVTAMVVKYHLRRRGVKLHPVGRIAGHDRRTLQARLA